MRPSLLLLVAAACAPVLPEGRFVNADGSVVVDDCDAIDGGNPGSTEVTVGGVDDTGFRLTLHLDPTMLYQVPPVPCDLVDGSYTCEIAEITRTWEPEPDLEYTQLHALSGTVDLDTDTLGVSYARTLLCTGCTETTPEECHLDVEWVFDLDSS